MKYFPSRIALKVQQFAVDHLIRFAASFARGPLWPAGLRRHTVIVPPSDPGSVGDAAMVIGLVSSIDCGPGSKIKVLLQSPMVWGLSDSRVEERYVGPIFQRFDRMSRLRLLPTLFFARRVYVMGADVIDGSYSVKRASSRLLFLKLANNFGCGTGLVGFSVSSLVSPQIMELFRSLPDNITLCPRDPISTQRLATYSGGLVRQSADLAFLLDFDASLPLGSDFYNWEQEVMELGYQIIVVNINYLKMRECPEIFDIVARNIMEVAHSETAAILLVPHDSRGYPSDVDLCLQMRGVLEKDGLMVFSFEFAPSPQQILRALQNVDLVVTGRMHLAILSLHSGKVPLSLAYQEKFEGLYALFELPLEELLLKYPALKENTGELKTLVIRALRQKNRHESTILKNRSSVRQMSKRNMEI